jgi:hypothetical protein
MKEDSVYKITISVLLSVILSIYCFPDILFGFVLGLFAYSLFDAFIKKDL